MSFEEHLNNARYRISRLPKGSQITVRYLDILPCLSETILDRLCDEGYLVKAGNTLSKRYKVR